MIDYNKYSNVKTKHISVNRTIRKERAKRINKLTEENKRFLKLIGLLK